MKYEVVATGTEEVVTGEVVAQSDDLAEIIIAYCKVEGPLQHPNRWEQDYHSIREDGRMWTRDEFDQRVDKLMCENPEVTKAFEEAFT